MATQEYEQLDVAHALLEARRRKRMSGVQASKAIGISRITYARWEKGHATPKVERAQQIATFTDYPKDEILSRLMWMNGIIDHDSRLQIKKDNR